jgi:ketosteroid isomerase-like protein
MNDQEATKFVRDYFAAVFETRDLAALDEYLHPDYRDDDIGDDGIDHIEAGRAYLKDLYKRHPSINVSVKKAVVHDGVITSYLEWSTTTQGQTTVHIKGTAGFVMESGRIRRRHTFVYYNDHALQPTG